MFDERTWLLIPNFKIFNNEPRNTCCVDSDPPSSWSNISYYFQVWRSIWRWSFVSIFLLSLFLRCVCVCVYLCITSNLIKSSDEMNIWLPVRPNLTIKNFKWLFRTISSWLGDVLIVFWSQERDIDNEIGNVIWVLIVTMKLLYNA